MEALLLHHVNGAEVTHLNAEDGVVLTGLACGLIVVEHLRRHYQHILILSQSPVPCYAQRFRGLAAESFSTVTPLFCYREPAKRASKSETGLGTGEIRRWSNFIAAIIDNNTTHYSTWSSSGLFSCDGNPLCLSLPPRYLPTLPLTFPALWRLLT